MSFSVDLVPQDEVRIVQVAFGLPGAVNLVGSIQPNEDGTDLEFALTLPELPPEALVEMLVSFMDAIGAININGQNVGEVWEEA